jgi:serine/threonine protein kinase
MLSLDRWQEISPYLDQALGLPEEERGTWLKSIRTTNPDMGILLESVLDDYDVLQKEEFLQKNQDAILKSTGLAGQQAGAYTLLSEIGRGGMGSVWLAERSDGRFERQVAIKFLHVAFAGLGGEERFRREGETRRRYPRSTGQVGCFTRWARMTPTPPQCCLMGGR